MNRLHRYSLYVFLAALCLSSLSFNTDAILSHIARPQQRTLRLYWKDDKGKIIGSLNNLNSYATAQGKTLIFAMNGGMYQEDQSPQGLYIERGIQWHKIETGTGYGNFYMKPNGVFYLTSEGKAVICKTEGFKASKNIVYATQSGPMLLIDDNVHPAFKKGSVNLNIRNGVGILPNGDVLFAMSKTEVNFYDFAMYFKHMGCRNALYLDGFVSRAYLPSKGWKQTDGNFGVIIAEVK